MKIAIVAPPWIRIPPEKYGGIEVLISLLADGLVDKGHEVTLFTVGISKTKAHKRSYYVGEMVDYLDRPPADFLNVALTHTLAAYLGIAKGDYDIVHDHTWKEGLLCGAFTRIPVLHTLHGPFDQENKAFYSLIKEFPGIYYASISDFQRQGLPDLNYVATVYNSVDLPRYPFRAEKDDYLFWIGRFNDEKAPHLAVEVARRLGEKIILAGKVREKAERDYFERHIEPYLGPQVEFVGEVGQWSQDKMDLLSHGKAYVYPIQWDEPFGITMIEAMACGTPVVTFRRGSAPEVVEDGVTGYVVDTMEEFEGALGDLDAIDPRDCRARVERLFTSQAMINGYEAAYERILEDYS